MVYPRFQNEFLPRFCLPPLTRALLLAFRNADVKAERIAQLLGTNPHYVEQLRLAWLARRRDPEMDTAPRPEKLLVQLGMENSRDLVIAFQLRRAAQGDVPVWRADGTLSIDPAQVLSRAKQAETIAAGILGENPAFAFGAGLFFDWLAAFPADAETRAYIDVQFALGLKSAQIASALGRRLPALRSRRYLFAASLVHASGKALLALTAPDFARFDRKCMASAMPRPVAEFAVRSRYGVTCAMLASQACAAFGIFRAAERPLLFSDEPYLLRMDPKATYQFAATLRLASNIAIRPKRIDDEKDAHLKIWKGLELRELPIDAAELVTLSKMI